MSFNSYTKIKFISDDEARLEKLYNYLMGTLKDGCFLQYYNPEIYFNNETQNDVLQPNTEIETDSIDYNTLAFVGDIVLKDNGKCFGVKIASRNDPPIVYLKELCDLCFKGSDKGIDFEYISENWSAHTYFTNISSYKNCFAIDCFHSKDEETDELKTIESLAYNYTGKLVTQDKLIEKLSPFYPKIKTNLDSVLEMLEKKYKDSYVKFIKVDYCPYGEF